MSFTDVQRVLGLFADGMAGAPLPIEVADDELDVWPWRGVGDRRRRSCASRPSPPIAARCRAVVLHHTGLTEFGSFDGDATTARRRSHAAARPGLVRRLFGVLEDRRVDDATAARLPGCSARPRRVLRRGPAPRHPTKAPVEWRRRSSSHCNCTRSARLATSCSGASLPGLRPVLEAVLDLAAALGSARRQRPRRAGHRRARSTRTSTLEGDPTYAVDAVGRRRGGGPDRPARTTDRAPDARCPAPAVRRDATRSESDRTQLGRLADVECGPRPRAGRRRSEEPGPTARSSTDPVYPPARRRPRRPHLLLRRVGPRRRAQAAGVVPRRRAPAGGRRPHVHRRRAPAHGVLIGRLRRQLAFMRPEGWVRVHHADEGDELDLDAVIEAVVDRRTGHSVDDRLHIRRDRAVRDVATAFLVDLERVDQLADPRRGGDRRGRRGGGRGGDDPVPRRLASTRTRRRRSRSPRASSTSPRSPSP